MLPARILRILDEIEPLEPTAKATSNAILDLLQRKYISRVPTEIGNAPSYVRTPEGDDALQAMKQAIRNGSRPLTKRERAQKAADEVAAAKKRKS